MKKKEVIAYVHTHWDREWYREFEVFRLRLVRVFDNILNLLEHNKIPSFYFDGQVSALVDYLKLKPENEDRIKALVKAKKLFIGPFYCLVDEFLTDEKSFRKNLEIGLKISKHFGCEDFIGYFADTFGHSKFIPDILKDFKIDKAVVWRGVGDLPSEFVFNGVNTVNLVRGYFMDIFNSECSIEQKAEFLKKNLDMISEKSGNTLLLPIGGDHLDVPENLIDQIIQVNELLDDYEIHLGSIFEYFEKVKFKKRFDDELRDCSKTFILPGSYSARLKLKQQNRLCSYRLDLADKLQKKFGSKYNSVINYAYKLLLQNQAHDSICGCSTDDTHDECFVRYKKILQIAQTIVEEIRFSQNTGQLIEFGDKHFHRILEKETISPLKTDQIISKRNGFESNLLYDTYKVPVTENYTTVYTVLQEFNPPKSESDLNADDDIIQNKNIKLEVKNGKINLYHNNKCFENFIEFVRYKDLGDTYNYAPDPNDSGDFAKIKSAKLLYNGHYESAIEINTSFFKVIVTLKKMHKLLNFKINWNNLLTNKLWQVRFNLDKPIKETQSDDMGKIIKRKFDPEYDIRQNLPKQRGHEAKTNTAPMTHFVWSEGFGVITKGLTEYEVFKNSLSITLLRSTGIISNPHNSARTTPAGPPIEVIGAQQLGKNSAEFSFGFYKINDAFDVAEEVYPNAILL